MKPFTLKRYLTQFALIIFLLLCLTACNNEAPDTKASAVLTQYIYDPKFPGTGFNFKNVSWLTLSPTSNEIYFLQRGTPTVSIWNINSQFLGQWNTNALGDPHSLSFQQHNDGSWSIWITDMAPPLIGGTIYGHCLKQFNLNGDYLHSIGTCGKNSQGTGINPVQFDKVTDIAFDSKGYLWVTDGDINGLNNRVLQINQATAKVLQVWSAPNNQPGSGEKQFHLPHSIDIDACDRVWIADALNHRVQVITTSGVFLQQLQCFGNDGVYGVRVKASPGSNMMQLFTTSSPITSPTGGMVKIFNVSAQCNAALPVPEQCSTTYQWPITLPKGSSTAMLHMIEAAKLGQSIYIAPLGGDLAPQKWIKIHLPAD